MMHALTTKLARHAKGETAYSLDPSITRRSLALTLLRRGLMLVRGRWAGIWWRQCEFPVFVGRGVSVRDGHLVSAGKGVVIEDYVTIEALSSEGISLGNGVTIARYSMIRVTGVLGNLGVGFTIGDHSNLGEYSYVGAAGGVRIGERVAIGQRVSFHAENHVFADPTVSIRAQGVTRKGIVVEDDCWIGAGAIILDGVTVGRGAVVAAGAVVTRSVPAMSVVGGVPARQIGRRG